MFYTAADSVSSDGNFIKEIQMKKYLAVIAFMLCSGLASAQTYTVNFSQSGWTGGGTVTGSFTCTDANSDGVCTKSELSAFSASYSGGTVVGAFALGLSDVQTFTFSLSAWTAFSLFVSQVNPIEYWDPLNAQGGGKLIRNGANTAATLGNANFF